MSNGEKSLPLEGIKVLAFTHAVMGPAGSAVRNPEPGTYVVKCDIVAL